MTQQVFPDINPSTTDGNQLAQLLNDFRDSYLTANSGPSQPSYVQEGTIWLDDSDRNNAALNIFTIGGSTTLFTIDLDTGTIATSTDTFPTWNVSTTYSLNDVVWYNDAQYRSTTNNNLGVDPETDNGAAWIPIFISQSMTLAVPSRFSTPQAAYGYLAEAVIAGVAIVTIEITGVVNISSTIFPSIALIPSRVVLKGASTVSMPSGDWYFPGVDASNVFQPSSWQTAREDYWGTDAVQAAAARATRVTNVGGNLSQHFPNRIRMTTANVIAIEAFSLNDFGEIRDLCIEGPVNQTGTSGQGIKLTNGASMRTTRCLIFGFANAGVELLDYSGVSAIDTDICGTEGPDGHNVVLERTSTISFQNSAEDTGTRITHAEKHNANIKTGSVAQFEDLQCWGALDDGIRVSSSSDITLNTDKNSTVKNVVSFNWEYGLKVEEGCSFNIRTYQVKANGNSQNNNEGCLVIGGNLSSIGSDFLGNAGSGIGGQGCDIYLNAGAYWANSQSGVEVASCNGYFDGIDIQASTLAALSVTSSVLTVVGGQMASSADGNGIFATTSKIKLGTLIQPVDMNTLDLIAYMSGIDARNANNVGNTVPLANNGPDATHGGVITT